MTTQHVKKITRRLKLIEGQVRGLQRMVQERKYCFDILRQASATRQALVAAEEAILLNHLQTHIVPQIRQRKVKTATQELMRIYSLTRKAS